MICYLFQEPSYFFFAADVPPLLYYSHIPTTIIALFVGLFVFFNGPKLLLNKLLLLIAICFSLWSLVSLTAWTNIHSDWLLFAWSFYGVLFAIISILCVYFFKVFLTKKDVSFNTKLIFILLLLPVLLFAHTDLSLKGFNITLCDAFEYEGMLFKIYSNLLGLIAFAWIFVSYITNYKKISLNFRKQLSLMFFGIEFFLLSFFSLTFFATYLAIEGYLYDSRVEMYGMFGMTVFMVFLGIMIVKFKSFNARMLTSQALILGLIILIGSQFTFLTSKVNIILNSITLVLICVAGYLLIKSAKKEVRQREEIEKLAVNLATANTRLKEIDRLKSEFVSIASHQLRSPITAISGYASLLREGSYGPMTARMLEPLERIEQSSRMMATSIEDYLNVSRIESGNMKYVLTDFNLTNEAEHIADDLRSEALKGGLIILFKKNLSSMGIVNADVGKVQQIIHNLINNSIKYTQRGTITVYVHDDPQRKKIYVDILDTGVGMSEHTISTIFQKFERGNKANTVNVKGTGLGLYVALKMAEAMGGDIGGYSEGEGKGSRFTIELPLVM